MQPLKALNSEQLDNSFHNSIDINISHKFTFVFQLSLVGLSIEYIDIGKYY